MTITEIILISKLFINNNAEVRHLVDLHLPPI